MLVLIRAPAAHASREDAAAVLPGHPSAEWDVDGGPAARLEACAAALKKCLDRMQVRAVDRCD